MLTNEEINMAAEEHILNTCSPADIKAVKDYAKEDFVAGARFAVDKCLEEYNDLLSVIDRIISLEELEQRAKEKNIKFKLFK